MDDQYSDCADRIEGWWHQQYVEPFLYKTGGFHPCDQQSTLVMIVLALIIMVGLVCHWFRDVVTEALHCRGNNMVNTFATLIFIVAYWSLVIACIFVRYLVLDIPRYLKGLVAMAWAHTIMFSATIPSIAHTTPTTPKEQTHHSAPRLGVQKPPSRGLKSSARNILPPPFGPPYSPSDYYDESSDDDHSPSAAAGANAISRSGIMKPTILRPARHSATVKKLLEDLSTEKLSRGRAESNSKFFEKQYELSRAQTKLIKERYDSAEAAKEKALQRNADLERQIVKLNDQIKNYQKQIDIVEEQNANFLNLLDSAESGDSESDLQSANDQAQLRQIQEATQANKATQEIIQNRDEARSFPKEHNSVREARERLETEPRQQNAVPKTLFATEFERSDVVASSTPQHSAASPGEVENEKAELQQANGQLEGRGRKKPTLVYKNKQLTVKREQNQRRIMNLQASARVDELAKLKSHKSNPQQRLEEAQRIRRVYEASKKATSEQAVQQTRAEMEANPPPTPRISQPPQGRTPTRSTRNGEGGVQSPLISPGQSSSVKQAMTATKRQSTDSFQELKDSKAENDEFKQRIQELTKADVGLKTPLGESQKPVVEAQHKTTSLETARELTIDVSKKAKVPADGAAEKSRRDQDREKTKADVISLTRELELAREIADPEFALVLEQGVSGGRDDAPDHDLIAQQVQIERSIDRERNKNIKVQASDSHHERQRWEQGISGGRLDLDVIVAQQYEIEDKIERQRNENSNGQASNGHHERQESDERTPSEIFHDAFPQGFELINTSGEGMLCGLHAVIHSLHAQHPNLEVFPTLQQLLEIVYDKGSRYYQVTHDAGAYSSYDFSADQISLILLCFYENASLDYNIVIGYKGLEAPANIVGTDTSDRGDRLIVWIHNDRRKERVGALSNHWEGLRQPPLSSRRRSFASSTPVIGLEGTEHRSHKRIHLKPSAEVEAQNLGGTSLRVRPPLSKPPRKGIGLSPASRDYESQLQLGQRFSSALPNYIAEDDSDDPDVIMEDA